MHKFSDKVPEPTCADFRGIFECETDERTGRNVRVFYQISKQINVDASQIAKDLSYVNISGRTRVGYEIDALIEVLERFFGIYQDA